MKRLKLFIPVIIFAVLGIGFYTALDNDNSTLPSVLVGKSLPDFSLPSLEDPQRFVTAEDLQGEYALLNVWATWCLNCRIEHPLFMELAARGVTIYGLNWRDPERQEALAWLEQLGDPYALNIADVDNRLGLDLGVYGAPETFLLSPDGTILHKHVGVVSQHVWENDFLSKMQGEVGRTGE